MKKCKFIRASSKTTSPLLQFTCIVLITLSVSSILMVIGLPGADLERMQKLASGAESNEKNIEISLSADEPYYISTEEDQLYNLYIREFYQECSGLSRSFEARLYTEDSSEGIDPLIVSEAYEFYLALDLILVEEVELSPANSDLYKNANYVARLLSSEDASEYVFLQREKNDFEANHLSSELYQVSSEGLHLIQAFRTPVLQYLIGKEKLSHNLVYANGVLSVFPYSSVELEDHKSELVRLTLKCNSQDNADENSYLFQSSVSFVKNKLGQA